MNTRIRHPSRHKNSGLIQKLKMTAEQVTQMLRRVTNRQRGMKEQDTTRLVQAFILSRITYMAPYVVLNKAEEEQLDVIIRKAYKQALGIPMSASTDRLLKLGLHNTASELIEGHLSSQKLRLELTPAGKKLLAELQWTPQGQLQPRALAPETRQCIRVRPIPRNMHPEHHADRRQARAKALEKMYGKEEGTVYTEAASYKYKRAMVAVVTSRDKCLTSATIPKATTQEAEEVAIALAITQTKANTIVSDSQQACRRFIAGSVSAAAHHILNANLLKRPVMIVWAPAHSSLVGNEFAHATACALANQATEGDPDPTPIVTYRDITQHYRLERRIYPPPHSQLSKKQGSILRLLQTNTFPHPVRLHMQFPNQHSPLCKFCGHSGSLYHIVWECSQNPNLPIPFPNPNLEQWETALSSAHLADQVMLTERAERAKTTLGLLD